MKSSLPACSATDTANPHTFGAICSFVCEHYPDRRFNEVSQLVPGLDAAGRADVTDFACMKNR